MVEFKEREVNIDLRMPDGKRFKLVLPLFQPIEPAGSTFEVMGTKVEIIMKKGMSWMLFFLASGRNRIAF